jgi:hypothetical protein
MSDKLKHFIVGAILGIVSCFTGHLLLCFIFASIIFIGKEIYDIYKTNPTGFDIKDLIADYAGFSILIILKLLI